MRLSSTWQLCAGFVQERERGQSVTEVSVAGMHGRDSEMALETASALSQPRALSEYSVSDVCAQLPFHTKGLSFHCRKGIWKVSKRQDRRFLPMAET